MSDIILLLRPLCQDFVEEEYCIERISAANYYEIKVLLKLNSFIFYLINLKYNVMLRFELLWLFYINIYVVGERGVTKIKKCQIKKKDEQILGSGH